MKKLHVLPHRICESTCYVNGLEDILTWRARCKLAEEIFEWDNKRCFEHMATYATAPPMLPKTFENSHGMRFWQADVLNTLGKKYEVNGWVEASKLFRRSGEEIIDLCKASLKQDRQRISESLIKIVEIEKKAYGMLKEN